LKSLGFKISCSDLLERFAQGEDALQGFDIADFFLKPPQAKETAQEQANAPNTTKAEQQEPAPSLGRIKGLPDWLTLHPDGIHINDIPLENLSRSQRQRFHTYILDNIAKNSMLKNVWDFYWLDIVA
jgi:hypothetical protein